MKLSIVVIGDEILLGQVCDTNSGAIARTFGPEGWTVEEISVVGDSRRAITDAVSRALTQSDLVITTGGLGPTKDDLTKDILRDFFGGEMIIDPAVSENIREVFAKRGLRLNALTEGQAIVPSSCRVIQNRYGTAPIMWFERQGRVLVAMPGVPFETEGMLPEVSRQVKQHFRADEELLHHTLIVGGITESALAEKLDDYERSLPANIHLAYLPKPGLIRLRLDGCGKPGTVDPAFDSALSELKKRLGGLLIFDGDASPAEILIDRLRSQGLTVATAESCTGGNIAHSITAIAGASDVFPGSVVSYSNSVKQSLLGVETSELEAYGAVSQPVVEQMALGACRATGASCAIATSGIAGPGGGSPQKPVGTVWMGWCVDGRVYSRVARFPGDRTRVIDRATTEAILGLIKLISPIIPSNE